MILRFILIDDCLTQLHLYAPIPLCHYVNPNIPSDDSTPLVVESSLKAPMIINWIILVLSVCTHFDVTTL